MRIHSPDFFSTADECVNSDNSTVLIRMPLSDNSSVRDTDLVSGFVTLDDESGEHVACNNIQPVVIRTLTASSTSAGSAQWPALFTTSYEAQYVRPVLCLKIIRHGRAIGHRRCGDAVGPGMADLGLY